MPIGNRRLLFDRRPRADRLPTTGDRLATGSHREPTDCRTTEKHITSATATARAAAARAAAASAAAAAAAAPAGGLESSPKLAHRLRGFDAPIGIRDSTKSMLASNTVPENKSVKNGSQYGCYTTLVFISHACASFQPIKRQKVNFFFRD